MFEDSNGNVLYSDNLVRASHKRPLPAIPEDKYLDIREHHVPDNHINLECDEVIEDWDNLSSYPDDVYSPVKQNLTERQVINVEYMEESQQSFYDGSPPPNSPVSSLSCFSEEQGDLSTYEEYMNDILKLWKEGEHVNIFNNENLHSHNSNIQQNSASTEPVIKEASHNTTLSTSYSSDTPITDKRMAIETDTNDHSEVHEASLDITHPDQFISTQSSRSSSPLSMEGSDISYGQYRSVSPMILRSPSPLNSRSSSPRFIRSPSPLGRLLHELGQMPVDEYGDSEVPNGEFYAMRSYCASPLSDCVPDIDHQFHDMVEESREFPPYRWYVHQRGFNQAQDCIVPQLIEE